MTENIKSNGRKESVTLRKKALKDGSYSLYLDIYHNGKRTKEYLKLKLEGGTSRIVKEQNKIVIAQAETICSQRQIELYNGNYDVLHEFKTDTYFLPYYRKMCQERFKSDTQGNWSNWHSCLRYLEAYCDESTTFKDITKEWVEGFKTFLENVEKDTHKKGIKKENAVFNGLSANSKHSYFNKLKACINNAYDERIIAVNPLRGVKGFKEADVQRQHLTWEEVKTLIHTDCQYPAMKNAFLFSCFTGLRKSDIERLRWSNVHENEGMTRIVFVQKKTCNLEYLDIPEQAEQFLPPRGEPDDLVFRGFKYGAWMCLELSRWVLSAGITKKITFHCARHTFAVLMLNFGADIYTVSKLLGHREIRTTQIYARVLDKKKQEAVKLFPSLNESDDEKSEAAKTKAAMTEEKVQKSIAEPQPSDLSLSSLFLEDPPSMDEIFSDNAVLPDKSETEPKKRKRGRPRKNQ